MGGVLSPFTRSSAPTSPATVRGRSLACIDGLQCRRDFSYLVEEQRALIGEFNAANSLPHRARVCTSLGTE